MTQARSEHLTVYGLVGVALFLFVGVLIVASGGVIASGWLITLSMAWLVTGGIGAAMWRRTVWVPLLAAIALAAVWMIVFFGSR